MQNTSILNHSKNPMKMHKSSQTFIVKVPFFVKNFFLVLEMDLTVEHLIQSWLVLKDAILPIFNPSTPKLHAG